MTGQVSIHHVHTAHTLSLGFLGQVRELLELVGQLRQIDSPLTSRAGLLRSVALLVRLGELLRLDPVWLERARSVLDDPAVLNIVLAVMQYVCGLAGREETDGTLRVASAGDGEEIRLDEQGLLEWLPLVIQIIALVRQIRGERA